MYYDGGGVLPQIWTQRAIFKDHAAVGIGADRKSNEITAAPKLLRMLALKGAMVTADPLNCQRNDCAADRGSAGDCALALKGKQGTLFEDVVLLLDDPELKASASAPLVEADHGRIETRTATVSTEIDWLMKQHQWPGLQAMGNVVRVRETAEKTKAETAHYLLSRVLSPDRFNAAVRQHWSVENNLRWRLDVVMNEDQDRTRMGHGPQNLAVLRHLVINAMQKDQKARCAENSNTKAGTTISSTDSWRRFEKRLPWTACAAAFEPCSPSVILQSEGSAAIPGLKRKWRTDLAVLVEGRLGGKG